MTTLYLSFVWLLAGFLSGITSFGGGLFAVPLSMLAIPPKDALIFGCLVSPTFALVLGLLYRSTILKKEFFLLLLSGILGLPLGLFILKHAPSSLLLLATGGMLTFFLLWMTVSKRLRIDFSLPLIAALPFGLVFGILCGALGLPGPILAIYGVLRGWDKNVILGMINLLAAVTIYALELMQWQQGMYSSELLSYALWAIPAGVAGVCLSVPVLKRINVLVFRQLLLGMISISAVVLLYRGVMAL